MNQAFIWRDLCDLTLESRTYARCIPALLHKQACREAGMLQSTGPHKVIKSSVVPPQAKLLLAPHICKLSCTVAAYRSTSAFSKARRQSVALYRLLTQYRAPRILALVQRDRAQSRCSGQQARVWPGSRRQTDGRRRTRGQEEARRLHTRACASSQSYCVMGGGLGFSRLWHPCTMHLNSPALPEA